MLKMSNNNCRFPYNDSHKEILNHHLIIRDIVKYYTGSEFKFDLDSATITPFWNKFKSNKLTKRYAGMLWLLSCGDDNNDILLFFEHQSDNDLYFPLKNAKYVISGLHDVLFSSNYSASNKSGTKQFPQIASIVLFNGKDEWQAPLSLNDIITVHNPSLELLNPTLSYILVDENKITEKLLDDNFTYFGLFSLLIRSDKPKYIHYLLKRYIDKIRKFPDDLLYILKDILIKTYLYDFKPQENITLEEILHLLSINRSWEEVYAEKLILKGEQKGELRRGLRDIITYLTVHFNSKPDDSLISRIKMIIESDNADKFTDAMYAAQSFEECLLVVDQFTPSDNS